MYNNQKIIYSCFKLIFIYHLYVINIKSTILHKIKYTYFIIQILQNNEVIVRVSIYGKNSSTMFYINIER